MCYRQILKEDELSRPCKFAIELIRPNSQVLEIGCATGYLTKELKNKGCEVTCIEIDPELAKIAKEFSKEMIVGDIEDPLTLKKVNKRFDYILLMDVLEHLRRPKNVLSAVKDYLNEGGAIIVNIPNIAFYSNRIDFLKGKFEYQEFGFFDATHLRFYTYKTSQELLINAGYKIERRIPWLYFPWEVKIERIPFLGKLLLKITSLIKHKYPNLFGFSFMYILRPNDM